jgi:N-methylhydantoinase A
LGIPRVLVPRNPGVLSTYGLLTADLRNDFVRTRIWRGPEFPAAEVQASFAELEADASRSLEAEAVEPNRSILTRSADLRYRGQNFELRIDLPLGIIDADSLRALESAFHEAHAARYSYSLKSSPVELVNLRVTATVPLPRAQAMEIQPQSGPVECARIGTRDVFFGSGRGWTTTACFERARLGSGALVRGPAVLQQLDSTVTLSPVEAGRVDRFGNLVVEDLA